MTTTGSVFQTDFGRDALSEERKVDARIMASLLGGTLLLCALAARWLFPDAFHSDLLAMLAGVLLGAPLIWEAARNLQAGPKAAHGSHMEELVALAFLGSFASGKYVEAGTVAFFMLLASFVEKRVAAGARRTIESLIRVTPTRARLLEDGGEREVPAGSLRVGDTVMVRPGDNIPADGIVLAGQSAVDEKSITGESMPVEKDEGSVVFAGSINQTGVLRVRVEKAVADSTLGRVKSLILDAASSKTPITRLLDQYAGYYTPTVLMLAGAVLFFTRDASRAISLLLIACPCAIILAGPTAMVAALSAAARVGVLVKNVRDFEIARKLTAILFDKTGTLTTGTLTVTRLAPADHVPGADLLHLCASAEQHSRHPLAQAVLEMAVRARLTPASTERFAETIGRGVVAWLDDRKIVVGRQAFLQEHGVDTSGVSQDGSEGLSVLMVAADGKYLGWIGLEDRARSDAAGMMRDLADLGIRRRLMVTGDREGPAQRVAAALDLTDV
ncbi:MAG: cadmium-translocating P-type ATPase, partial [Phycisphaeraceae bacterium]|nr:cadmium-translocating P-type ATPase [Phycisphaeraceae bacterium]